MYSYSPLFSGLGDDDFNIPPITPPTLPDHMVPPHLPHNSPSGPYHPLDPPSSSAAHHPYQLQGMELPGMPGNQDGATMLSQDGSTFSPDGGPMTSTLSVSQSGMSQQSQQNQLSTINQSQLGLSGNSATHNSPSPPGSKSATPSPSSSAHEDDNDDGLRKRPATVDISKKPKTPKKKKRKDPNEPVKPVSAYALFFRDTQANIKAQNPNATFGEVSKIVASMWDGLAEEEKQVYKKKTETAKKEYLKQLAAYRASLVSQVPGLASVPHQGALSLGNVAAASTPPLQVSPPLHSQAHLGGLHSPHHQHQQHIYHELHENSFPSVPREKPTQTGGEHANSTQNGPGQGGFELRPCLMPNVGATWLTLPR
uniref:Thymocyte selection-associated high mobility group box n=1 Tax=Amphilophus citrinellus TaxID=61819 RepID=A0A3Q0QVR4_AMPCI